MLLALISMTGLMSMILTLNMITFHISSKDIQIAVILSVQEFIIKISNALYWFENLWEHHVIPVSQAKHLIELKENFSPSQALISFDFAENTTFFDRILSQVSIVTMHRPRCTSVRSKIFVCRLVCKKCRQDQKKLRRPW